MQAVLEVPDSMPIGAIISVYAPNETFWLAQTCQNVSEGDVRLCVEWLEEVDPSPNKFPRQYILACDWGRCMIWRDCIQACISSCVSLTDYNVWLVPENILSRLDEMARENTTMQASSQPQMTSETRTIQSMCTVQSVQKICSALQDGIQMVCAID
jgi:hypothetical protein